MVKPSSAKDVLQLELPPQPRKKPRQARSIALVDALIKAGNEILEQEGRTGLSLQRVSEYAGVSVSSIYEYFPTLDALETAIFEAHRTVVQRQLIQDILALPPTARLLDGLRLMVRAFMDTRLRERAIDPAFAEKNLQFSELQRLAIVTGGGGDWPKTTVSTTLMERFADEVVTNDPERVLFLMYHTIQALPRVMALERPHYITLPDTDLLLARMLHALLTGTPAVP